MSEKQKQENNASAPSQVYAAFCGTGKSYLCNNFADKCIEFECWEYRKGNFPKNYIDDIKSAMGKYEYIFFSTDPVVLKQLYKEGASITLVYPRNKLKREYMERFLMRESHIDFIRAIDTYWNDWIDELKEQNYCEHILLDSGQYLQDVVGIQHIAKGD